MSVYNLLNREELNRKRLSEMNFIEIGNYLNDSLYMDWNEKLPVNPVPFRAFCKTNYANKHMLETCIMAEGDINGSNLLTSVVIRFYFRNKLTEIDSIKPVTNRQISNNNMQFTIVDNSKNMQYTEGNDTKLNSILKEYRRLVNPLDINKINGKIEILGYELYNMNSPNYYDMTSLEMLHKLYELEEEYLEIFDNLK